MNKQNQAHRYREQNSDYQRVRGWGEWGGGVVGNMLRRKNCMGIDGMKTKFLEWAGCKFFRNRNTMLFIWNLHNLIRSDQIRSVAQSCPTLCDPMNRSTPGLPVHHQLTEFTQTHIHQVGDDIHPSSRWRHPAISSSVVPFSSCPQSLPASESFPMTQLFTWDGQSTEISALASFLPKKSQGWSPSEWTGWIFLQSKDSQESSPTPQFKSINSSALSLLHSPTLTSIHDHRKNHSLD